MRKVRLTEDRVLRVEGDARFRAALDAQDAPSDWREHGACVTGPNPDLFFPAVAEDLEPARSVCRSCPVSGPCLAEALSRAEVDGVWGDTTGAERRLMRAVWRQHHVLSSASA